MIGKKKYKKGMADAAKAYEAFGTKQEEALEFILDEVRKGKCDIRKAIDSLKDNADNLYRYLETKERSELYTIYTPFDIKELDSSEKIFLLGALLRLTEDKTPNEEQQNYFRAIKKYLDIKELPFGVDPMAIENIESANSQKAIYQAVLEYLILQDGDNYDETEMQTEFLESFNLNSKNRLTIAEHVETLYRAVGSIGLAEKYGSLEDLDVAEAEERQQRAVQEENMRKMLLENEKKAIVLATKAIKHHRFTAIKCEDYILTFDKVLVNRKTGETESDTSWLPSQYTYDSIYFHNLCCVSKEVKTNNFVLIDFDNKKYKEIEIKIFIESGEDFIGNSLSDKDYTRKLLAMNDNFVVIKCGDYTWIYDIKNDETTKLACIPVGGVTFVNNDIYILHEQRKNYTSGSFRIENYILSKYSTESKELTNIILLKDINNDMIKKHLGLTDNSKYSVEDQIIYGNNLYVLTYKYTDGYHGINMCVVRINIEDIDDCDIAVEKIYTHQKYDHSYVERIHNGWLFVSEHEETGLEFEIKSKYILQYFSCEENRMIEIAANCGYGETIWEGLFKNKSRYLKYPSDIFSWGNYVFFNQGKSATVSYVSIKEPMDVHN